MTDKKDYYVVLGVPHDASARGIRRAFCRLARDSHPDIGGPRGDSAFRDAVEAYEVLSDPERRRRHDESLRGSAAPQPRPAATRDFANRPFVVEPLEFERRGTAPWAGVPERLAFDSRDDVEPEPLIPERGFAPCPGPEPLVGSRRSTPFGREDDLLRLLRSLRLFF